MSEEIPTETPEVSKVMEKSPFDSDSEDEKLYAAEEMTYDDVDEKAAQETGESYDPAASDDETPAEETAKEVVTKIETSHEETTVTGTVHEYDPTAETETSAPEAETVTETTSETLVETVAETPVETTSETPVETVAEAPVETTSEAPVETVAETPVETTAPAPVETSSAPVSAGSDLQSQAAKITSILSDPAFQSLPEAQKQQILMQTLQSGPSVPASAPVTEMTPPPSGHHGVPSGHTHDETIYGADPDIGRVDISVPMTHDERRDYENFLHSERDRTEFPPNSRLFIGNVPLRGCSKEDLWRIFQGYGHLCKVDIKNSFAFLQYDTPEAVTSAIATEGRRIWWGKKLILEISSSVKRQRDQRDQRDAQGAQFGGPQQKRGRMRIPECQIYVKRTADKNFAERVHAEFKSRTQMTTEILFLRPGQELQRFINDIAIGGARGVILVNNRNNVDVQIFYKGDQGETKFDEYVHVGIDDAVNIFLREKQKNPYHVSQTQYPPEHFRQDNYHSDPRRHDNNQDYRNNHRNQDFRNNHRNQDYRNQDYRQRQYNNYNSNNQYPPQQYPPQQYGGPPPFNNYPVPQPPPFGNGFPGQPPFSQPPMGPPGPGGPGSQPPAQNQQQLLQSLQGLPPNVLQNLVSMAHNGQPEAQGPQQAQQFQQQQFSGPPRGNNGSGNVQSLLDSLAKLQK